VIPLIVALIMLAPTPPANSWPSLVSASYLEEIGRLSHSVNLFVDALLEKVSFLADIVIESSMEEQCQISCSADLEPKLVARIRANRFDGSEYTSIGLFVNDYIKANDQQADDGCKLFGFSLEPRDLPVGEMEICCRAFKLCYSDCTREKFACDLEFRECLKAMCKKQFDYRNESLVRIHEQTRREAASSMLPTEPIADDLEEEVHEFAEEQDQRDESAGGGGQTHADQSAQPSEMQVRRLKDKYKACKLASKVLIIGNLAFSCQVYRRLQFGKCCQSNVTSVGFDAGDANRPGPI